MFPWNSQEETVGKKFKNQRLKFKIWKEQDTEQNSHASAICQAMKQTSEYLINHLKSQPVKIDGYTHN